MFSNLLVNYQSSVTRQHITFACFFHTLTMGKTFFMDTSNKEMSHFESDTQNLHTSKMMRLTVNLNIVLVGFVFAP